MTGPIPYQCIQPCGGILFAARGANIHTFNLESGSHLSTWKYPTPDTSTTTSSKSQDHAQESTPPAKRRKVEEAGDESADKNKESIVDANSKPAKKKQKANSKSTYFTTDQPIISLLVSTTDGKHLVAVTSHDKVIRVFEHDQKGNLKDLSQRTMPKRPCSVLITPDSKTIISADKFGDLYSLPLIDTEKWVPPISSSSSSSNPPPSCLPSTTPNEPSSASASASPSSSRPAEPSPAPSAPLPEPQYKMAATSLTVHTQRNRQALEHQKLHQLSSTGTQQQLIKDPTILCFAHTLLLGHVSMLTSVSLGRDGEGRSYIISADRDEHIRVSRGAPQSHVIETFCLGHREFVSRICVPENRPELLVSGGGDDEIFLWDWLSGKLLAKENILTRVQEVVPGAKKVAVSGLLCAFQDNNSKTATVAVTCERIAAVFIFEIGELPHISFKNTVPLAGNPIDICFIPAQAESLVVSIDLMDNHGPIPGGLQVVSTRPEADQSQQGLKLQQSTQELGPQPLSTEELRKLLYTTEHLRKCEAEDEATVTS